MEWWQAAAAARALGGGPPGPDLTHDSRQLAPGMAFAAGPGFRVDGHDYLEAALAAGASALVVQADREEKWARLRGRVPLVVVGAGRAALEGTVVQRLLARAVAAGRRSMAVEASSEGLALQRLAGCRFDLAVFTNLTRDHLDFHGTMERYLAAKGILFEMLDDPSTKAFPKAAGLNADDEASAYLKGRSQARPITYGLGEGADVRAEDVAAAGFGLRFRVQALGGEAKAVVPLMGRFHVYNSLAAVAAALSQGVSLRDAVGALASFAGVPGRLERIDCGQPFQVFIDIASTPAALAHVLEALRPGGGGGGGGGLSRAGVGRRAARRPPGCGVPRPPPRPARRGPRPPGGGGRRRRRPTACPSSP